MQELIRFNINNYELCLLYDGNKTYYAKRENGKISYDVSNNDKALIRFVYKQVMPSKNLKARTNINIAGKTYAHFIDDKLIHVFYELKNEQIFIPEVEIRKQLNYLYNNQEEKVYDKTDKDSKSKEFFKRLIKLGKKTLIVLVATSAILGFDYLNHNKNVIVEDESPSIILQNIESNYNLDETESKDKNEHSKPQIEETQISSELEPEKDNIEESNAKTEEVPPSEPQTEETKIDIKEIDPEKDNIEESNAKTEEVTPSEPQLEETKIDIKEAETKKDNIEDLIKLGQEVLAENEFQNSEDFNLKYEEFRQFYLNNNLPNEIINIYNNNPELKNYPVIVNHNGINILLTYNAEYNYVSQDNKISVANYEDNHMEIPRELQEAFPNDKITIAKERKIKLTYDDMVNLINLNPNLTQEEKNFIMSNPKYINENLNYMDHNYVFEMLLKLKINYLAEANDKVSGTYFEFIITLYKSHDFSDCDKYVFTHELCHAFSCPSTNTYNRYIEIINNIINNEYWGNGDYSYDIGYGDLKLKGYALLEVIGSEPVKKAYFKQDTKDIKEELLKIIADENMADELLESLDLSVSNFIDPTEVQEVMLQNDQIFNNLIKTYYEAKYQRSIEENEELMYYLNPLETAYRICFKVFMNEEDLNWQSKLASIVKAKSYFNNLDANDNYMIIRLVKDFSVSIAEDNNGELSLSPNTIDYVLGYANLNENLTR